MKVKLFQIFSKILAKREVLRFQIGQLKRAAILLVLVTILLLGGKIFSSFWFGPKPILTLASPVENAEAFGENLYIKGSVIPVSSEVKVNNASVSLNGDGSFTALVKISPGENIIKVTAKRYQQEAEVLRLVTRKLTNEEQKKEEEAKAKKGEETKVLAMSVDQEIANIEAIYKTAAEKRVRIITNSIKMEGEYKRIEGEVLNDIDKPVSWVKITATFFNAANQVVDTKVGFAVSQEETLPQGGIAPFKTQSTQTPFEHYKLDVSWEEVKPAEELKE